MRTKALAVAHAAAAVLLAQYASSRAQAAVFYWDTNGTATTAAAATGTWGVDNFWSTDSTGATATVAQTIDNSSDLIFSAAANSTGGVVTISGTQLAHSITFDDATGAITLSGGTSINLGSAVNGSGMFATGNSANVVSTPITLNSAATTVTLSNSVASLQTIGALTGSASSGTQTVALTAGSSGSITLNGVIGDGANGGRVALAVNNTSTGVTNLAAASNTYSGGTTVWAGTLAVGTSSNLGSNVNTNNININYSGILTVAAAANVGSNQTITLASAAKTAPTAFSSAGTAGPVGRLAVLGLGFNGVPANIAQADTNGGVIAINGVTGYNTDLSAVLTGKNLYLGAIGTSTFTGAAGTIAAGNGSTYRLGGGGGQITFSTGNLFTSTNSVQVGSTFVNGGGTVVFGAAQDYSGTTTVSAGTLTLNAANGAAVNSSGFTLNGGKLFLDSSTANNADRIGTFGVVLSNSGELSLSGNAAGTTETFGNLTIGPGTSTVTVKAVTANSTLAGAVFSRTNKGTALFRGTALGTNVTPMGAITMTDISGLSLVGASTLNNAVSTDSSKDVAIVPYLIGDTTDTGTGATFVTYDTTLGFRALNTTNQFNSTATADTNVRLAAAQAGINTMSINSLIVANTGSSTITDGQTLTVTSGAVLFSAAGTIAPSATTGKLDFGTAEGVISGTGTISAVIGGSGGLTKAGTGTLTLSGTNTYTGGTVINGGVLKIAADANLGNAGDTITVNGNSVLQTTGNVSSTRGIVLNNGAMLYQGGNTSFTTSGNVSGTGGIGTANVSFGAIITLNGTNNTFEGPVIIGLNMTGGNSSKVTVNSLADSSAANGRIVFASLVTHATLGSTFTYTGTSNLVLNNRQIELAAANTNPGHKLENNSTNNSTMTVNTDLVVTGTGARVFQLNGTGSGVNAFNGKISDGVGAPVSLVVNTAGTWTLSNANTYSGGTTITAGTLSLSGGNNRLLSGSNLAFTGAGTFNVGSTSQTLAAIAVPDQLSMTATISGTGGNLTLSGTSNLEWGPGGAVAATSYNTTVNLGGLSNFVFSAPANTFRVGYKTGTTNSTGAAGTSTVTLAANNTITAATLNLADIPASNHGGTGTLHLGANNTLNVGNINVGYASRSNATLDFNATSSAVTIRNTDGTSAVSSWNIGKVNSVNSTAWTDSVDLSKGTIDALVTTMNIGTADPGTGTSRQGTTNASFTMSAGALTVGTMNIGQFLGGTGSTVTATLAANGTFTLNSPSGTLNVSTLNLATNTGPATGGTRTVNGTFNLTNGIVNATTVQKGDQTGGTATATAAFNWASGTIANISGTNLTWTGVPITLSAGTHTFNISGSNTATLDAASVIGGGAFAISKTGTGVLALAGNNTYSGGTTITGGTLVALNATSSTGAGAVLVSGTSSSATGTVAGTGTIAGPVTVNAFGAVRPGDPNATVKTGVLTVAGVSLTDSTSTLGVKLNGTAAGTQYDQLQITSNGTAAVGGATLSVNLGIAPSGDGSERFVILSNLTGGAGGTDNPFSLGGGNYFAKLVVEPTSFAGAGGTFNFAAPVDTGNGTFTSSATDPGSGLVYTVAYNFDSATPTAAGNDVVLTVVPEPGLLSIASLAGIGLLARRRRAAR